jgi:hypothetical protein
MAMYANGNGGLLSWLLRNIEHVVAALVAALAILQRRRPYTIWVWVLVVATFVVELFSRVPLPSGETQNSQDDAVPVTGKENPKE